VATRRPFRQLKLILKNITWPIRCSSMGDIVFNNCEKGPILMINKKIFENVDHLNVIEILGKEIED
jgi:NADH:ubiquinone oxidoreductase subunit E